MINRTVLGGSFGAAPGKGKRQARPARDRRPPEGSRRLRGHRRKEREMNRKMLYVIAIVLFLIFVAIRVF